MNKLQLNEDLFPSVIELDPEVIEVSDMEPQGPEQGEDTGIANLIHDLIIDENEAIQGYNNAKANVQQYPEIVEIFEDISTEEFNHIGMLQKALEIVSPNEVNIEEGEVEAETEILHEEVDENGYYIPVDHPTLHADVNEERFNEFLEEIKEPYHTAEILANTLPSRSARSFKEFVRYMQKFMPKLNDMDFGKDPEQDEDTDEEPNKMFDNDFVPDDEFI